MYTGKADHIISRRALIRARATAEFATLPAAVCGGQNATWWSGARSDGGLRSDFGLRTRGPCAEASGRVRGALCPDMEAGRADAGHISAEARPVPRPTNCQKWEIPAEILELTSAGRPRLCTFRTGSSAPSSALDQRPRHTFHLSRSTPRHVDLLGRRGLRL